MRTLWTIALLWVAAPALSIAASGAGSFESLAQTAAASMAEAGSAATALPRPGVSVTALQPSNYSLTTVGRGSGSSGLKTAPLHTPAGAAAAPLTFSEGARTPPGNADPAGTSATQRASEQDPSVSTPVPEPQSYALMIAGLVAVGFMAMRRGRG